MIEMIDIKELRRLVQDANQEMWVFWHGVVATDVDSDGAVVVAERPTPSGGKYQARVDARLKFIAAANPAAISELLDRLEAAETELAELRSSMKFRTSLIGRTEAERDALRAKIEAAERERDECNRRRLEAADHFAAQTALMKEKYDDLRVKIEEMGKQEPLDAGSDVFRSAFEAALKAGNWPATRQGDGYRSPSTQIAWRIAFSTVNRLKLYLAPGAQGEEE